MDTRRLNLAMEYLGVLDLDPGSGIADVREAYRLQVRTWSPDHPSYDPRVKSAAERRFAEIQKAYEWLQAHSEAVLSIADAAAPGAGQKGKKTGRPEPSALRSALGLKRLPPERITGAILYLMLVGMLIAGIAAISTLNPGAWLGPL